MTPRRARIAGIVLVVVGALGLAVAAFVVYGGSIEHRRAQRSLKGELDVLLASGAGFNRNADLPNGTPVAMLDIPVIGLSQLVAEGTSSSQLKGGPGHLPTSAFPGQTGNAVIAGHRAAFGGPFKDLNALRAADEIGVLTPYGRFKYVVKDVRIVHPGEPDLTADTSDDRLTLTTANPAFGTRDRLVVTSSLSGAASSFRAPPRRPEIPDDEASFVGDPSAAFASVLLLEVLGMAVAASVIAYRRLAIRSAYLVTTPVLLALSYALVGRLLELLPGTL